MMPNLNGKWTGELIYDERHGKLAHEALFFVVELNRTGDEFKGVCVDVDGIGMNPSEAGVSGFIDQEQINFVKEYKTVLRPAHSPDTIHPTNKQGAQISFSGIFNASTKEFEGEWINFTDFMAFNNNIPGQFKGGTWRMRKEG